MFATHRHQCFLHHSTEYRHETVKLRNKGADWADKTRDCDISLDTNGGVGGMTGAS